MLLKFRYFEKAEKFEEKSSKIFDITTGKNVMIFSNFCRLLRIPELYTGKKMIGIDCDKRD